jgi:glycosyltransferase involved in cell wall biosynthesis
LAQTLHDFEFIISDDCSTDEAWETVLNLAKQYPRIRAIQTPKNMGMCGNANFAANHTSGEFIALLHHGDIYREDLLERWLDVMERYNTVGFVFNETISKPATGPMLICKSYGCEFSECMNGKRFLEEELLSRFGCWVWGTTMIRRTCWDAVGGMRVEFGMLADVDLWMRLAARWDVGYVDEPLITLQNSQDRPDDYPSEYRKFSWTRQKLIYSVHGSNLAQHYSKSGLRYWWKWFQFRARVSKETCKWLTYAIVRKQEQMLRESIGGECPWEWPPVRWYRNCLLWGQRMGIV